MPLTLRPTGLGGYARANPQQPATLMAPPIKIEHRRAFEGRMWTLTAPTPWLSPKLRPRENSGFQHWFSGSLGSLTDRRLPR